MSSERMRSISSFRRSSRCVGRLDVDELRHRCRGQVVLVLEAGDLLVGGDPAVAVAVDADEDVGLGEVRAVQRAGRVRAGAELEHHRRQVEAFDRGAGGAPLVGELAQRRADEHPQPLVGRADRTGAGRSCAPHHCGERLLQRSGPRPAARPRSPRRCSWRLRARSPAATPSGSLSRSAASGCDVCTRSPRRRRRRRAGGRPSAAAASAPARHASPRTAAMALIPSKRVLRALVVVQAGRRARASCRTRVRRPRRRRAKKQEPGDVVARPPPA